MCARVTVLNTCDTDSGISNSNLNTKFASQTQCLFTSNGTMAPNVFNHITAKIFAPRPHLLRKQMHGGIKLHTVWQPAQAAAARAGRAQAEQENSFISNMTASVSPAADVSLQVVSLTACLDISCHSSSAKEQLPRGSWATQEPCGDKCWEHFRPWVTVMSVQGNDVLFNYDGDS